MSGTLWGVCLCGSCSQDHSFAGGFIWTLRTITKAAEEQDGGNKRGVAGGAPLNERGERGQMGGSWPWATTHAHAPPSPPASQRVVVPRPRGRITAAAPPLFSLHETTKQEARFHAASDGIRREAGEENGLSAEPADRCDDRPKAEGRRAPSVHGTSCVRACERASVRARSGPLFSGALPEAGTAEGS